MIRTLPALLASLIIGSFASAQDAEKAANAKAAAEKPVRPEAFTKAEEAARKGDFAAARKILEAEGEKGNGEALSAVGEMVISGQDGKADPVLAAKYFQRAVDAGFASAHMNIARLLATGAPGVEKDEERARFHVQQAAEAGVAAGQVRMAMLLEADVNLSSREPNWKEPREWLEKALAQGSAEAAMALVPYLDEGRGGDRDSERATELCFSAAKGGSALAMNEIGVRYQKGLGIRKDNVAAIGWFSLASQQNFPAAMVNLGNCYERGEGALLDLNRAGGYYAAAAKLNHPVAQLLLGKLFEEGKGTKLNLTYAYVNYSRAASQGLKAAEAKRDEVAKRLTPAQKSEAEKLIKGDLPEKKDTEK